MNTNMQKVLEMIFLHNVVSSLPLACDNLVYNPLPNPKSEKANNPKNCITAAHKPYTSLLRYLYVIGRVTSGIIICNTFLTEDVTAVIANLLLRSFARPSSVLVSKGLWKTIRNVCLFMGILIKI